MEPAFLESGGPVYCGAGGGVLCVQTVWVLSLSVADTGTVRYFYDKRCGRFGGHRVPVRYQNRGFFTLGPFSLFCFFHSVSLCQAYLPAGAAALFSKTGLQSKACDRCRKRSFRKAIHRRCEKTPLSGICGGRIRQQDGQAWHGSQAG